MSDDLNDMECGIVLPAGMSIDDAIAAMKKSMSRSVPCESCGRNDQMLVVGLPVRMEDVGYVCEECFWQRGGR